MGASNTFSQNLARLAQALSIDTVTNFITALVSPSALDSSTALATTATVDQKIYTNTGGGLLSGRNRIVDSLFVYWTNTAAAAISTTGAYLNALMYYGRCGTGGAATLAQYVLPVGTAPAGMVAIAGYYAKWAQTTGGAGTIAAGTAPVWQQNIESVISMNGHSATYSLWLWTDSGTVSITNVCCYQNFGTGGSQSSPVPISVPVSWVVTTTPQRFSVRVDLPSIVGKTVGTNTDHSIAIGIYLPISTVFTLNSTQWQFEQCPSNAPSVGYPTPLEVFDPGVEIVRVRRLYRVMPVYDTSYGPASAYINESMVFSPPFQRQVTPTPIVSYSNAQAFAVVVNATEYVIYQYQITAAGGAAFNGSLTYDARFPS